MFAVIYPGRPLATLSRLIAVNQVLVCTIALLVPLYIVHRRAKKNGAFDDYQSPVQLLGARELAKMAFWYLDVVGAVLMIACLALILVPFTIAHGEEFQWETAKIIAPLVLGVCCIPAWVIWERKCKHPMVPFNVRIYTLDEQANIIDIALATERPGRLGCPGNCCHVEYRCVIS